MAEEPYDEPTEEAALQAQLHFLILHSGFEDQGLTPTREELRKMVYSAARCAIDVYVAETTQ